MFGYIPRNVWQHSPECLAIFLGMFEDILRKVWRHSPKCLATFPGMFGDIPRNITFPHSQRSVPRSCIPGFIHSRCSRLHLLIRTYVMICDVKLKVCICIFVLFYVIDHNSWAIFVKQSNTRLWINLGHQVKIFRYCNKLCGQILSPPVFWKLGRQSVKYFKITALKN